MVLVVACFDPRTWLVGPLHTLRYRSRYSRSRAWHGSPLVTFRVTYPFFIHCKDTYSSWTHLKSQIIAPLGEHLHFAKHVPSSGYEYIHRAVFGDDSIRPALWHIHAVQINVALDYRSSTAVTVTYRAKQQGKSTKLYPNDGLLPFHYYFFCHPLLL